MISGVGVGQPYFDPNSGITGTPAQHAEAIRKKRETEDQTARQQEFQQQQQEQRDSAANTAQSGYTAGRQSGPAAADATRRAASTSRSTGAGYAVDAQGNTAYNDAGAQARRTAEAQAKLAADAEARRLAALHALMKQYGGSGQTGVPPTVTHPGAGVGANEAAARAAAFGRAKDQTGQITRGAVDSLRSLYAGSGNTGAQRQGLENIVAGGAGALNEFTRDQLMADLQRQGQVSDMTYQGGITQRGQDINRPINPQLQALISLMGTIY